MQSSEISSPRGQENPYLSTSSQFSRCLWACGQYPVPGAPAGGTDNIGSKARSSQKSVFVAIPGAFSHPAARFAVNQSNRPKMAGKSVVSGLCTQVVQCRQNAWIAGQCHTLHGTAGSFPAIWAKNARYFRKRSVPACRSGRFLSFAGPGSAPSIAFGKPQIALTHVW